MPFALVISSTAQHAIYWEEERSDGLGKRFLDYLDQKFAALMITPYMGSIRYENVRCTTVNVFDYLIHYIIEEHTHRITILRVLNTKRKPVW